MEGKSRSRRISRAGDELGVQLTRESLDLIYFLDKYKVPSRHWRFSSLQANTKVETSTLKCNSFQDFCHTALSFSFVNLLKYFQVNPSCVTAPLRVCLEELCVFSRRPDVVIALHCTR